MLFDIESRFDANEAWPPDPVRNTEASAARALDYMKGLPRLPILFANHPSRSATGIGQYGLNEPRELRNNHDRAPNVYRGMEGAPGHQAGTLAPDGTSKSDANGTAHGLSRRLRKSRRRYDRWVRPDDRDRRRLLGLDARRRTPLLDSGDLGFPLELCRPLQARDRTSGPASIRRPTFMRSEATTASSMVCGADGSSRSPATS